jgi:hypothetical protein
MVTHLLTRYCVALGLCNSKRRELPSLPTETVLKEIVVDNSATLLYWFHVMAFLPDFAKYLFRDTTLNS